MPTVLDDINESTLGDIINDDSPITMKEAYIGDQVHITCPMGKYIQPLTVTNNKNVVMQGIKMATEKDNIVNVNLPFKPGEGVFSDCKKGGKCKLLAGMAVNWEKVNKRVSIGGAKTLNGDSCFKCPFYLDVEVKITEHNQNNFDFSEENKAISEEEVKTPSPLELFNMLKDIVSDPQKRKAVLDKLSNEMKKELGYAKEVASHLGGNTVDAFKDFDNFTNDPSLKNMKSAFNSGSKMMDGLAIDKGLINAFAEESKKKMSELMDKGMPKEKILDEVIKLGDDTVNRYVDRVLAPVDGKNISPEAKEWYKNSLKQVLLGAGAKENTLFGSALEIGTGMIPYLGQAMDIRDTVISGLKGDFWGAFYSFLGVLPLIGDLVKKSPALMKLINKLSNRANDLLKIAGEKSKLVSKMTEFGQATIKQVGEFIELIDKAKKRLQAAIDKLNPKKMIVAKLEEIGFIKRNKICDINSEIGCFVEGTLVKTKSGYKKIEDICIGEKVYTINLETHKFEYQKVVRKIENKVKVIRNIVFQNNVKVQTTLNHEFYVKGKGFIEARDLEIGDAILNDSITGEKILEIEDKRYFERKVLDLKVEKNHNYFVSNIGLLVHNNSKTCAEIAEDIENLEKQIKELDNLDAKINNGGNFTKGDAVELTKLDEMACFTYNTQIYSPLNKKIGEIVQSNIVYSYNHKKKMIEEKKVINTFEHEVNTIVEVFLENGEKIETTKEHKFYSEGKYQSIENLISGDELICKRNKKIKIIEKREIFYENSIKVYNFEVKDNHNYYVGNTGVLVHNEKKVFNSYDEMLKDKSVRARKDKPKYATNAKKWFENHDDGFIIVDTNSKKWTYGFGNENNRMLATAKTGEQTIFHNKLSGFIEVEGLTGNHKTDMPLLYKKIAEDGRFGKNANQVEKTFREYGLVGNHITENGKHGFEILRTGDHNVAEGGLAHMGDAALMRNSRKGARTLNN